MQSLVDAYPESLAAWLVEHGVPAYRRGQIGRWLLQGRADSFEQMTNLPAALRTELSESFRVFSSDVVRHQTADDGTEKLLLAWPDGGQIECVLLRDGQRRTVCVSTQVGCAMGCVFCASGLDGLERNLGSGEIVQQMLRLQRLLPDDERLSHIVVMGMGEPLANLDGLLPALELACSADGLGISPRRVTISTVGLPKAIHRLADLKTSYHLAVSLHAPDDALRNRLVPINKSIGLRSVLAAADRYFDVSGRRLTYEYVVLAGVNDGVEHARGLVRLLSGRTALLNLIPFNPVSGLPYRRPSAAVLRQFRDVLEQGGLNVQQRMRKGTRIDAACGQLRRASRGEFPNTDLTSKDAEER